MSRRFLVTDQNSAPAQFNTSGATDGQGLVFNAATGLWVPGAAGGGGGSPTGAAGGDLSGTYPNPTVAKVKGKAADTPTTKGDVYAYDGTALRRVGVGTDGQVLTARSTATVGVDWEAAGTGSGTSPTGAAGGDLSGTYPNPTVAAVQGKPADVPLTKGDLFVFDGSNLKRLGVGPDGYTLTSRAASTLGVDWEAVSGGGGGSSAGGYILLTPSGDTTGVTDDVNMLNAVATAVASGQPIGLLEGTGPFYTATGWAPPANAPAGTITGTTTTGSNQVTGLANGTTAVPAVGSVVYVYGPGIPAGSTLTIYSSTTGTLSNAVVGGGSNVTMTVGGQTPGGNPVCIQGIGTPTLSPVGQANGLWYHRTNDYGDPPSNNPPAGYIRNLIIDGSHATSATQYNLINNPNFEYDTPSAAPADWPAQVLTTATINTWLADSGWGAGVSLQSGRLTLTINSANGSGGMYTATGTGGIPVTAGATYQMQAVVNVLTLGAAGSSAEIRVRWYNSTGALLSSSSPSGCSTTAFGVTALAGTVVAPSTAAFAAVKVGYSAASGTGQNDAYFDDVMFSQSSVVLPYADGDTGGWTWSGTPGDSQSSGIVGGIGLDVGDGDGFDINVQVQNFNNPGQLGAYLVNRVFETTNSRFTIRGYRNNTQVYVDIASGGDQSFSDCKLDVFLRANTNQNGVVVDTAHLVDCALNIRGSLPPTSATVGSTPTNDVAMLSLLNAGTVYRSEIEAKVQADNVGTTATGNVFPWTLFSDGAGAVKQCNGSIVTDMNGTQMNGAECSFSGPYGYSDALTWPSTAFPNYGVRWHNHGPDALVTVTGGTVTSIGVNLQTTGVTSGTFFVAAGGNIRVVGSGTAPTFNVLPARMMTEGAPPPSGGGGGGGGGNATLVGSTVNIPSNTSPFPYDSCAGGFTDPCCAKYFDWAVFGTNSTTQMARAVQKFYFGYTNKAADDLPSTPPSNMTAFHSTGGKLLISFRPHWPSSTAWDNAFKACVAGCMTAFGTDWKGILFQEPNTSKHSGTLNNPNPTVPFPVGATDYIKYVHHYAPMFRANAPGIPLVFDPAICGATEFCSEQEALTYYPGDIYVDEIAVDFYCSAYKAGGRIGKIAKLADNHGTGVVNSGPVPFSVAEWAWRASTLVWDPSTSPTLWQNYINYLLLGTGPSPDGFIGFQNRRTQGFSNGWMIWWAGMSGAAGASDDWLTTGDPKIPGVVQLYNALAT